MDLEDLVIRLGLDPDDFQRGLDDAARAAGEAGSRISEGLIAPLQGAIAGLAASFGFSKMLGQYTEQADAVGKLADSMEVDIEKMQAWSKAAALSGGTTDQFYGSLRTLNSSLTMLASTGQSRAKPILEAFGIAAKDASGKAKDAFTVLEELAGKAETMGKAQFAGLAQRLGLDQGTIMLLQSGRLAVQDLVAEMRELGGYTKEDAEIAAAYNDAVDKLKWSFEAIGAVIMRSVVPVLTAMADKIREFAVWIRRYQPFILSFFGTLATLLTVRALPALASFARAVLLPWAPVIALITAVALVIDDLIAYINGAPNALGDFWSQFGTGEEILQKMRAAWEEFQKILQAIKPYLVSFIAVVTSLKGLDSVVKGVLGLVRGFRNLVFVLARNPIFALVAVLTDLCVYLYKGESALGSFWKRFGTGQEIIERIKAKWNEFAQAFREKIGTGEDIAKRIKEVWGDVIKVWERAKYYLISFLAVFAGFKAAEIATGLVMALAKAIQFLTIKLLQNPFAALFAALVDLGVYCMTGQSALDGLWKKFGTGDEIIQKAKKVWDDLKKAFETVKNIIPSVIAAFVAFNVIKGITATFVACRAAVIALAAGFSGLNAAMRANLIIAAISLIVGAIVYLVENWDNLGEKWEQLKNWLGSGWDYIVNKWNAFVNWVANIPSQIVQYIVDMWEDIKQWTAEKWGEIKNEAANKWSELVEKIKNLGPAISDYISNLWNDIKTWTSEKWESIKDSVSNAWGNIVSYIQGIGSTVSTNVSNIWESIKSTTQEKWEEIKNTVKEKWESFTEAFSSENILNKIHEIWDSIVNFFSGVSLFESGKKLLETFGEGIVAAGQWVVDKVKGVFEKVRSYMPFSDAKEGPFSQLTLSGERLMTTFAEGAERAEGGLLATVDGIFGRVRDSMRALFSGEVPQVKKPEAVQEGQAVRVDAPEVETPESVEIPAQEVNLEEPKVEIPEDIEIPAQAVDVPDTEISLPGGIEIPAQAVDVPEPDVNLPGGVEIPAQAVVVPEPEVSLPGGVEIPAQSVAVPEPDVNLPGGVEIPAQAVSVPDAEVQLPESLTVPGQEISVDGAQVSVGAAQVDIEPPAPIMPEAVAVPAPEISVAPAETVKTEEPERPLGARAVDAFSGLIDTLSAKVAAEAVAFRDFLAPVVSMPDRILSVLSDFRADISDMGQMFRAISVPSGEEYAMAGIAPSITEMSSHSETSETHNSTTTNIGTISIQTQATDADGIASGLRSAVTQAFSRSGTNSSISGVRQ